MITSDTHASYKHSLTYLATALVLFTNFSIGSHISAQETKIWEKKELLFEDNGTEDWTQKWFLDGTKARVEYLPTGMYFAAGPNPGNDISHAVLWTQQTF